MSQELIGELYQRYLRGELTLDDAAEQIFALTYGGRDEPSGLAVDMSALDTREQERTLALFDRLQWHTLRAVLPEADIPLLAAEESTDRKDRETRKDIE